MVDYPLSSSHVNKVLENVSLQDKCKYCGKRGHDLRKDSCPAFGKKCKNCGFLGHFNEQCRKKPKDTSEEHNKSSQAKQNNVQQNTVMIKKMQMNMRVIIWELKKRREKSQTFIK